MTSVAGKVTHMKTSSQ